MKKMTLKGYALKHKLSLFNVVKMTKSGDLETEQINENGKDITYILIEEKKEEHIKEQIISQTSKEPYSLRQENKRLKEEILSLHQEIERLKKQS